MLRSIDRVPETRSTSFQRSPQSSPRRHPVTIVSQTITLLTECMTLEPGDVIIMGTPAGVGQARTPPVWMKGGDTVEIEIERIGVLRNPVVDEAA